MSTEGHWPEAAEAPPGLRLPNARLLGQGPAGHLISEMPARRPQRPHAGIPQRRLALAGTAVRADVRADRRCVFRRGALS